MNDRILPKLLSLTAVLIGVLTCTAPARAQVVTINGSFEFGFTSWTRVNQVGSDGDFFIQIGTTSPVNGTSVPAPTHGIQAAMSDAQGPGSHVLFQDFVVPTTPILSAELRFDLFIGNRASAFFTPSPATLDFATPALNQQARVDILAGSTDPFSVAAADVLMNAYQTVPGDPLVSGYTTVVRDVTALMVAQAGNTLRLRFAEVDNVFMFQMGVDNVSLTIVPIPEPSAIWLVGVTALALRTHWPRRRKAVSPRR